MDVRAGAEVYEALAKFERPDRRRGIVQIVDTLIPYLALWAAMILTIRAGLPYAVTLALTVVAGAFAVRLFIIFHDCCHGSFFASRRANTLLGYVTGVLTFTPYEAWQQPHAVHHATVADLDRRGVGDIWTMTVDEYRAAPRRTRFLYRTLRNPFILFVLGPPALFLVYQRFPHPKSGKRERRSTWWTDAALALVIAAAIATMGLRTYLLIQVPIMVVAGLAGTWLFYVQHQFEGVYWARHGEWEFEKGAVDGSSFYKLPRVLQWITGSIGYHHIHHLSPKIPNYYLEKCYRENPIFQNVKHITLKSSLRSLRFRLWDEEAGQLVGYKAVAEYRRRHGSGIGAPA
jgi:omega-6 fatty acid desaturase (delta-12 desaturase)